MLAHHSILHVTFIAMLDNCGEHKINYNEFGIFEVGQLDTLLCRAAPN